MIKPPLVTFCSILGLFTIGSVFAGPATTTSVPNSVQGVAENEILRRQESLSRAREAINAGNRAMSQKSYDLAAQQFKAAAALLPESPSTHDARTEAVECFADASVQLAEQRIAEGRFADAEAAARSALEYDPNCSEARTLLYHLQLPDYYNKTVTPGFHAKVDQVNQWFVDAKGYYATGRYELAFKRYEQILNVDPTNIAARKGMEEVNQARDNYNSAAYDEARSRAIMEVDGKWARPVRKYGLDKGTGLIENQQTVGNTVAITAKLNRIIIPKVEFRDATVREAIDFLKEKSRSLDVQETDVARRGVNIVLQLDSGSSGGVVAPVAPALPAPDASGAIPGLEADPAASAPAPAPVPAAPTVNPSDARITLSLSNVPLIEVLRYITQLAGLKVKIDPYAVAIVPITVNVEQLITKEYKVPPGFLANAPSDGGGAAPTASATASSGGFGGGPQMKGRQQAKAFLELQGVQFPPGASANFIASSSRLIVRNTQDNLDLIDTIVDATIGAAPRQVDIEAKFVEITQNNLKELSFDWLLGQFKFGGDVATEPEFAASGGTSGNGTPVNPANYPNINPATGIPYGQNPVTAGNRSGSGLGGAISANAIDSLLFPSVGATSVAPSIFGLAGVFTNPQFQVVVRALNQKKGVDLLSSPRVTTKSGQRATIEIIREFKYPTEFSPPQIPQTIGGGTGGGSVSISSIPVTPTTPTAFEVRNTGVSLEVEPVVGPDGSTIDLNLVPSVVEFEGFINYGSPILSAQGTGINTLTYEERIITPNVINQPIFSTRKITTSVSIWDGQTVVLGGLIREDVQKVEDKVPFVGDLPLVGRLFRSSVDQHLKRNLMVFVTARLINPAGEPVNLEEEKEEIVEPLTPPALPDLPAGLPSK